MSILQIGFTGTQQGMTDRQKRDLRNYLIHYSTLCDVTFHHGLCIGSDEQAHHIFKEVCPNGKIHGHPPIIKTKEAQFDLGDFFKLEDPLDYLVRDKMIVDQCTIIIAAPRSLEEELRSGTWATVRYTRKVRMTQPYYPKRLIILDP